MKLHRHQLGKRDSSSGSAV